MSQHVQIHLDERILAEIVRLGELRSPTEACGVLLPTPWTSISAIESQVIELPNRSSSGHDGFIIWPSDIRLQIEYWADRATPEQKNALAIWHTHPQGNPGPSRGDLNDRLPGVTYLVVALTPNGGIPSWF